MARIPSAFYTGYQPTSDFGDVFSNIAKALIAAPGPTELAQKQVQTDYYRALTDQARAKVASDARKSGVGAVYADVARRLMQNGMAASDPAMAAHADAGSAAWMDPSARFASVTPDLARATADADKVGELGDVFRTYAGLVPGLPDETADRLAAGSGKPITLDQAKGRLAARNAGNYAALPMEERAAIGALPNESEVKGGIIRGLPANDQRIAALGAPAFGPSDSQVKGGLLSRNFNTLDHLTPQQQHALGAQPTAGTPRNYQTPDKRVGITMDGRTDENGQPLPQGSIIAQVQSTPSELRPNVEAGLQNADIALQNFGSLLKSTYDLGASDPTLFGVTGNARRLAQNVTEQLKNAGLVATGDVNTALADAARRVEDTGLLAQQFDPNLSDIDKMSTLLAFSAAEAVAGQSGRSVSDKDVHLFRGIVGDPTSFFSSQANYLSGLRRLDQIATDRANIARQRLGKAPVSSVLGAAGAPNAAGPRAPAVAPQGSGQPRIRIDAQGNVVQ